MDKLQLVEIIAKEIKEIRIRARKQNKLKSNKPIFLTGLFDFLLGFPYLL
jgi:hypothetical protein